MRVHSCISGLFLILIAVVHASGYFHWLWPKSTEEQVAVSEGPGEEQEAASEGPGDEVISMELSEDNTNTSTILDCVMSFRDNIWTQIDEAIENEDYEFLKSLDPNTMKNWRGGEHNFALLLAKAFGRPGWMSREEWEEHGKGIDWRLHFESLIRSKNENVYKQGQFQSSIFNSKGFKQYFKKIIQEAYDSKNFAFLRFVPIEITRYFCSPYEPNFLWLLSYGQEWFPNEWNEYINEATPDSSLEWHRILQNDNPKVFECERIRKYLNDRDIPESLEAAVKHDSLSLAEYLKGKHGPEEFRSMVANCSETHVIGGTISYNLGHISTGHVDKRLSRVYNLLLDNGKTLNVAIIEFRDVPVLDKEYLWPLLDGGFNKVPQSGSDLTLYGITETGIEFLKIILNEGYWGNGEPLQLTFEQLASITLLILDVEVFKLIDGKLAEYGYGRASFRQSCALTAIRKDNVEFLVATDLISTTIPSVMSAVLTSALYGNSLAVLDYILQDMPELVSEFQWRDQTFYEDLQLSIPLLRYLFKKLQPSMIMASDAVKLLQQAAKNANAIHYRQVIQMKGVIEAIADHGLKIPEFAKGK